MGWFEIDDRVVLTVFQNIVIILGGLSGRLDQTIHTLQLLHKLRKERSDVYAVTDDNIGWVLDEVGANYLFALVLLLTIFKLRAGKSCH